MARVIKNSKVTELLARLFCLYGLVLSASAFADDRAVLQCRATEGQRLLAGECGAHGCDCGVLKSECGKTLQWLKTNGEGRARQEGRAWQESRAWQEAITAYKTNCGGF